MSLVLILLGLLLFAMGGWSIFSTLRCTAPVEGTLLQAVATASRDMKRYAPVFAYEFGGQSYEGPCLQSFPGQLLRKKYVHGGSYRIFVDPQNPARFVLRRLPQAVHWLPALLGVLLVWAALRG